MAVRRRPERRIVHPPPSHHVERPDYADPEPRRLGWPRIPPFEPLTPRLRHWPGDDAIGFHTQEAAPDWWEVWETKK